MITIIVAITADKGAIGRKGDMLYHLRDDLRRFKSITTGHTVVMGRRTFESLPKGALPDRRNIVVTRNPGFRAENVETASSLEAALAMSAADSETFIIGGGEIYTQALPLADRLRLTIIDAPTPPDADTFFPPVDPSEWEIAAMEEPMSDPRNGVTYRFVDFCRCKKVANTEILD